MANLQPFVSVPPAITASPSPIGGGGGAAMASLEQLVLDLCDPMLREHTLIELAKVSSRIY
jgi:CCR4-NOT transcription complex subunit 9